MYTDEQIKPYINDLQELELDEIIEYIEKNKNTTNFDSLVEHCCNFFLDQIQRLFHKYDKQFEEYRDKQSKETNLVKLFIRTTEYITNDNNLYYLAVAEFFKGNRKKTIEYLRKNNLEKDSTEYEFNILDFANSYVAPFKEAFDGFWDEIYDLLSQRTTEKGVLDCTSYNLIEDIEKFTECLIATNHYFAVLRPSFTD